MITRCIVCGGECNSKYPQYEYQSDYFTSIINKDDKMKISYTIHYRCVDWLVEKIILKKEFTE